MESQLGESPKTNLDFASALRYLKQGERLQRAGWNAGGQYIYHVPENSYPSVTEVAKQQFGEMVPYNAYLAIKTVQNTVAPWAPSQTDVLAEDWSVVSVNIAGSNGLTVEPDADLDQVVVQGEINMGPPL